jgi:hypothetical protein
MIIFFVALRLGVRNILLCNKLMAANRKLLRISKKFASFDNLL